MSFLLDIPAQTFRKNISLEAGEMLFILGVNGTGKSSLMSHFAKDNKEKMRKISAHRQTLMNTDLPDITVADKLNMERNIKQFDQSYQSRYRDNHTGHRTNMTIYELINAENVLAREIAALVRADNQNMEAIDKAAKKDSPIKIINKLFQQSNIPIYISISKEDRIVASKHGGSEYSVIELSDGERNAFLIAGNVLTAPSGTLLLIDEPERHLHRSIISPLLSQLFELRTDCGFVISTHDYDLPLEIPSARIILLRSCIFNDKQVGNWEADELSTDTSIDDSLKRDLLGARRRILFVEGKESSLDKSLYNIIFPMVSVIPKGSCHNVERAVMGVRAAQEFHWLRAFGIVDGDGYDLDQIQDKKIKGVYTLPLYSIEAIYFHPEIIKNIAVRQTHINGKEASVESQRALAAGVAAITTDTERLSCNAAKKSVRKLIIEQIPNDDKLLDGEPITLENKAKAILTRRKKELDDAVKDGDWETILKKSPVRESRALADISKALGFPNKRAYEEAVRHLLTQEDKVLTFVRKLFDDLFDELNS